MRKSILLAAVIAIFAVSVAQSASASDYRGRYQLRLSEATSLLHR